MNFKLRNLVAATLAGSFLMGFGANAMADSTTDIVDALESKGVLTDEEAALINKGHAGEKEAKTETHKAAAADVSNKPMDFMNDDAPFKSNFMLGEHQADIQIYGIVDVGGASVNHSLPVNSALPNNLYPYSYDAAGGKNGVGAKKQTACINGGMQDSRIGLKGSIGLFDTETNKFKLFYQLETGFNPITGELNDAGKALAQNSAGNCAVAKTCSVFADSSLNGYMFARQAFAGIDGGNLGKVSYGIQYNPFYDIAGAYDPNHKSDSYSPLGESGAVGGGGGVSENARMKNSIKYANSFAAPMDGKINVSGMYQFGNDVDTDHGRGYAAQVGYENSLFGFQTAYNNFTDSVKLDVGTSSATPVQAGLYNTEAWMLAGKFTPNKEVKFSGGYEWYQLKQPTDNNIAYGSVFGYNIVSGFANTSYNSSKSVATQGDHQNVSFWWLGGEYDFAERFPALAGLTASAAYYYTDYGTVDAGGSFAGVPNKDFNIKTETAILDYKINKRFDVYAAATWNKFSGTYINAGGASSIAMPNPSVDMYGVGVRMKF